MGSLVLIQAASKSLMQQFGAPERRGSSSRSSSKLKYIITPKQHHSSSSSSSSSSRGTTVVLLRLQSNDTLTSFQRSRDVFLRRSGIPKQRYIVPMCFPLCFAACFLHSLMMFAWGYSGDST
jgi:hypothetical protein